MKKQKYGNNYCQKTPYRRGVLWQYLLSVNSNPRCLGVKDGQYAVILLYNLCFIPCRRR